MKDQNIHVIYIKKNPTDSVPFSGSINVLEIACEFESDCMTINYY